MIRDFFKRIRSLEIEEQILNLGAFGAAIGVFFPWSGGHLLGSDLVMYSGFGFYTSFIGISVFLLSTFVLLITFIPLTGGPIIVRKRHKNTLRLVCGCQSVVLILAALSVLMRVTFEFSRMEIRFGIYMSLVGSIVVGLYSFLRYQEQRKSSVEELFHHPETEVRQPVQSTIPTDSPPLPPSKEPEEYRMHTRI